MNPPLFQGKHNMKKLLLSTVVAIGLTAPTHAVTISWDFGQHPGLLAASQGFSAGGETLTARGFDAGDVATALYSKLDGGDENGLGLNNDPSGNHEISVRNGFVQLNLDGPLADHMKNFTFSMGSTTQGEGWGVWGSQDSDPFNFTFLIQSIGTNDEGVHTLAAGYDNYNFFYLGGFQNAPPSEGGCDEGCNANVLLHSFGGELAVGTPEPSTWAMGVIGFGLVGLVGLRKSRAIA
jgi:hypothetical protein